MKSIPNNVFLGERYVDLKVIGDGSVGKCFLARDRQNGVYRIIKIFKESKMWDSLKLNAKRLFEIDHDNIVKILSLEEINGYHCLIQERVSGSSLDRFVENSKITVKLCLRILEDILSALRYMQINEISHKDIKPSNIIYDPISEKATLVDIDYTMIENKQDNKFFGTIMYSAPEQVMKNETSIVADCYSLGLVLSHLIIGEIPFSFDLRQKNILVLERLKLILCGSDLQEVAIKNQLYDLLKSMLELEPNERISISEALKSVEMLKFKCTSGNMDFVLRDVENIFPQDENWAPCMISIAKKTFAYIGTTMIPPMLSKNFFDKEELPNEVQEKRLEKKKERLGDTKLNSYRSQLIAEYDNILLQARIAFGLWVGAVVICFCLVFFALYFIAKGEYIQCCLATVLDAFVLAVQKLFHVREDHYRKMVNQKLKHLEEGDSLEYVFEKADDLDDPIERNREAMELLKKIKECSRNEYN